MSESLLDVLVQAKKNGEKIEVRILPPSTLTKEEAMARLRGPAVFYHYRESGHGFEDARYEFNFHTKEWKKELIDFDRDPKSQGTIPDEVVERFLEAIWTVCNLPENVYATKTKRVMPASEEEQYILGSDAKRTALCRMMITDKMFQWVPELDTQEPYCILTAACLKLLEELGI